MTRLNSSRTSEITKVAAKLRTDALLVGLSKTFTAHDADIDLFKKTTNLISNGTANGMKLVASSEEKKVLAKLQRSGKVSLTYAERRTLTVVLTRHQKTIETARRADLAALNSEIETIRSNPHMTANEKTASLKDLEAKRSSIENDFKASATELSIAKKKYRIKQYSSKYCFGK